MLTKEQRAEINRKNAQKSTGPKTEAGKTKVRLNAMRHNITGQTIVMFVEDVEHYEKFKESFFSYHQPVGPAEKRCVECIVDASWKMNEGSALQTRMLSGSSNAVIHHKLPDTNKDVTNAAFASGEVVTKLTQQLANLSLYEQHHFRTYEKSLDRLAALQKQRKANEAGAVDKKEAPGKEAEIADHNGHPSPAPYIPRPIPRARCSV